MEVARNSDENKTCSKEFGIDNNEVCVKYGVSSRRFYRNTYRVFSTLRQRSPTNYEEVLQCVLNNSFDVRMAGDGNIPEKEDWLNVGYTLEGILSVLAVREKSLNEFGSVDSIWDIFVFLKIAEECSKFGTTLKKMREIAVSNLDSLPSGCLLLMLDDGVFCYKDQYVWAHDTIIKQI
jgi:hypothetical protein